MYLNTSTCVVCLAAQAEGVQYHLPNAPWPNPDIMRTMPFDYTIHDPKYDDISAVYCPGYRTNAEGKHRQKNTLILTRKCFNTQPTTSHLLKHHLNIVVLIRPFLRRLPKETQCVRRTCTYEDGPPGLSCLNMQRTTPITTVNSVISTWASTPDTRSASTLTNSESDQ